MASRRGSWIPVVGLLALAACAGQTPAPTVPSPPAEVSRNVAPYRDAMAQRQYAAAVAGLRPIVQAHPDHVDAKLLLADAYFGQADLAQASRLYAEVDSQATTPRQRAEARAGLGLIELYDGDPARAEQYFRDALADDPQSAVAHNGLGQSLDRQGRHGAAKDAFRDALRYEPGWAAALNNLGLTHLHLGELQRAERAFLEARDADPTSPVIATNLRLALGLQGRYDEALAGIEPGAGEADALNNVGYAAMVRGDLGAASRYLHQAQAASPAFHPEADSNLRLLESLRSQRGGPS